VGTTTVAGAGPGSAVRSRARRGRPTPLHALGALAALAASVPLVYLVVRVSDIGWARAWDIAASARTALLAARSVGFAVAVAATCMVIGVAVAWLVTRTDLPLRRFWLVVAALPLAIPSYVTAYTWLAAFPWLQGPIASWFVMVLACTPYVVLPVAAVLMRLDPSAMDVARTLGLGPVRAFLRAVVPQVLPAAAAGGLLVALYSLSEFGVVSLLRFDTFTRVIYTSYRASFDRSTAAVLALVLVVLALLFVVAERRVRGRHRRWRTDRGVARDSAPVRLGAWRWLAVTTMAGFYGLAVLFPMTMLGVLVLRGRPTFDVGEWAAALLSTIAASGTGAVIAMALAIPVGVLAARHRDRLTRIIESVAFLGFALPGVTVGLSLVFFGINVAPALYQTLALLGFGYAVLFLSNAIGSVRSAVAQVPPVLEDVSRTLGVGPVTTWFRVTLPLVAPGVAAGALLVLLTAMKELPATLMLRPTGMDTLATELWSRASVAQFAGAAPYAVSLVLLAAVPAFVLARLAGRPQES
jgi:iron(III) transport system permease protein